MRVVALLSVRNEELFLARCIEHLHSQGIESCVIDNGSTDNTPIIIQAYLGKGVMRSEFLPYRDCFDLAEILQLKEKLTKEIDADWFMHCDADEIREAPAPYDTLLEGIKDADRQGYNAINFDEFVFLPTNETQAFERADYVARMQHYYFFEPYPQRRLNLWKNTGASFDLVSAAGHHIQFEGMRVFPVNFILRHYICLSKQHAVEKYGDRVFALTSVRDRGWSRDRVGFVPENFSFPSLERLKKFNGNWDTSDPWKQHETLFSYAFRNANAGKPTPPNIGLAERFFAWFKQEKNRQ